MPLYTYKHTHTYNYTTHYTHLNSTKTYIYTPYTLYYTLSAEGSAVFAISIYVGEEVGLSGAGW